MLYFLQFYFIYFTTDSCMQCGVITWNSACIVSTIIWLLYQLLPHSIFTWYCTVVLAWCS